MHGSTHLYPAVSQFSAELGYLVNGQLINGKLNDDIAAFDHVANPVGQVAQKMVCLEPLESRHICDEVTLAASLRWERCGVYIVPPKSVMAGSSFSFHGERHQSHIPLSSPAVGSVQEQNWAC